MTARGAFCAVLVAALAFAGPAVPPAAASHGSLTVTSSTAWLDSSGYLHISGVVVNNTASRQEFVEINATYYNASNQVIGTGFTFADLTNLAPHASSPFEIVEFETPSGYDRYSLNVEAWSTTTNPVGALHIDYGVPHSSSFGAFFPGEVTNKSPYPIEYTAIYVTLYLNGAVLNTGFTFTDPHTIPAGGTSSFEVWIPEHYEGYTGYRLQADAGTTSGGYGTSWDNYFSDLGTTGFRDHILWIAETGITTGCATARYCPSDSVTREQMAAFLARALDLPPASQDYFSDDENSTLEDSINRVREAGIASGCTATTYCPRNTVTREQMAAFLARALDLPTASQDYFTDDENSTLEDSINRVREAGVAAGCTATTYCPKHDVTRGQMAAFLRRAFD